MAFMTPGLDHFMAPLLVVHSILEQQLALMATVAHSLATGHLTFAQRISR